MNYKRKKRSKRIPLSCKDWYVGMAKTNFRKIANRKIRKSWQIILKNM